MSEHPIQGLMDTAMSNIKSMVDVNTIVGDSVTTPDGTVIIPITPQKPMFGGGCGGGAKVKPIAFLVVGNGNVRLLPISDKTTSVDKIIDMVPEVIDKVNSTFTDAVEKFCNKKKDKKPKQSEEKTDFVDVAE